MIKEEWDLKFPEKEFGVIHVKRILECRYKSDSTGLFLEEDGEVSYFDTGQWEISLEHSCDEWVIGNVQDARKMIKSLQEAIDYCKDF